MFENPRRGRQARNFTTNVPKILDIKSSSEQIFSENWRWAPLILAFSGKKKASSNTQNSDQSQVSFLNDRKENEKPWFQALRQIPQCSSLIELCR